MAAPKSKQQQQLPRGRYNTTGVTAFLSSINLNQQGKKKNERRAQEQPKIGEKQIHTYL